MPDLDSHLAAIVAGRTDEFARWMAGCEGALRDGLRGFATRVDTESVLQETFLRIWQVAPRFQPDGRPNGLLRLAVRIARNLAISETRRLRGAAVPAEDVEQRVAALAEGQGPRAPDPLLREAIRGCREELPARPAQALAARLASAGGASDAVLAAELGMTRNTFLQNFTRARKLLAACLEQRGVDITAELA